MYFFAIVLIGFNTNIKNSKNNNNNETDDERSDYYILAGRRLTLPLFVATLVSTWYGSILGVGEYVFSSGVVAWISLGLPYYFTALFYAFFITKKIRNLNVKSIPHQFELKYGENASILSAVLVLISTIPASYLLMLSYLIQLLFGFSNIYSLFIVSIISLLFIYKGGFLTDINLNVFQFILMFVGFIFLLYFSYIKIGDFEYLISNLPESHKEINLSKNIQTIIVWIIISFQTFIDPSFHQRTSATKNYKVAQKGIIISVIFWIIFDFLTLSTGLFSYILSQNTNLNILPLNSFPILADNILPVIFKGLFFVSLFATIMSSFESYSLISAYTLGKDILHKLNLKFKIYKIEQIKLIKISFIINSVISIIFAYYIPSVIDLIYNLSSLVLPSLLLPMIFTFSKSNIFKENIIKLIVLPFLFSFVIYLNKYLKILNLALEPMIVGMSVSVLLFGFYFLKYHTNKNRL